MVSTCISSLRSSCLNEMVGWPVVSSVMFLGRKHLEIEMLHVVYNINMLQDVVYNINNHLS